MRFSASFCISCLAIPIFCSAAMAEGYRPDSDLAAAFLDEVTTAEIDVFPTIVRDPYISRFSMASRDLLIESLKKDGLRVAAAETRFYLGKPQGRSQFDMFQGSIRTMAEQLGGRPSDADFIMVLEVLFAPGSAKGTEVFGIHVYVLTSHGDNAFSFLLNSHHRSFVEAKLRTSEATAKGKEQLAIKSTKVAIQALDEQLASALECAARDSGKVPPKAFSGVIDDFEDGLPSGSDEYRVPLGFSTFNGERSSATISTTTEHPPLPYEAAGNAVLRLGVDVRSWAGVLHSFQNEAIDDWVSYDWSGAQELSFWLYGNNSGAVLVIDVLDNRSRCSTVDDAERYSYQFVDDFSGWKLFAIPFEVMLRKEIGNDAPNDGLGLSAVHGWGFAVLRTDDEITYFIDDVRLRRTPLLEHVPEGLSRDRDVWSPVNELPMYGGYDKTEWQSKADEKFLDMVLPDFEGDREAAAEHFARVGWNLYYSGDKSTAIKRFNQAWLLHPENQNALWGFAVVARERGKMESAVDYYEMAVDQGPENPKLMEEYEEARRTLSE